MCSACYRDVRSPGPLVTRVAVIFLFFWHELVAFLPSCLVITLCWLHQIWILRGRSQIFLSCLKWWGSVAKQVFVSAFGILCFFPGSRPVDASALLKQISFQSTINHVPSITVKFPIQFYQICLLLLIRLNMISNFIYSIIASPLIILRTRGFVLICLIYRGLFAKVVKKQPPVPLPALFLRARFSVP